MSAQTQLAEAKALYERDGAAVLRGVIDTKWIDRIGRAADALMDGGKSGKSFTDAGTPRFFGDVFSWLHQPEFEAFIEESGVAEIAATIMGARDVRFFYDQLLVKEPGAVARTPWHQDLPYWPVSGDQIISIWVPIDPATPANGVVSYVRGSHRWKRFFPMQPFAEGGVVSAVPLEGDTINYDDDEASESRSLADIRDNPDRYEFLSWDVEPGDVLLHHALTIHGAPGNNSATSRRRALATRWMGEDARWDDSRPHFLRRLRNQPNFPYPPLTQGEPMDAPLFPII